MSIKVILKTLTPIHIGTGRSISPENYFYSGGKVYLLDTDGCLLFIKNKIGQESFFKNFNQWIENLTIETETSAGSRPRRDLKLSIFDFVKNQLKDNNLLQLLKNEIPQNNSLFHYHINAFNNPSREVKEQIKTATNKPFIPGSSFKGLIKNCLLNFVLNSNFDKYAGFLNDSISKRKNEIKKEISKARNDNRSVNYQKLKFDDDKPIENEIFCCKYINNKGEKKFDAKFDLFKFIQISDFYPKNENCLKIVEVKNITSKGNSQLSLTLEAIEEGTEFEGTITLKVDELKELYKNLEKLKKQNEWLDIEHKFPNVFGFPINSLNQYDTLTIEETFTNLLRDAVGDFSSAIVNKDIMWLEKLNDNPKNLLKNFYENLPENALKIGFSSGFHAVTIYDVLVNNENDNSLKRNYIELLEILKIIKNKSLDFPKHRKILEYPQNRIETFGWVSVDFE